MTNKTSPDPLITPRTWGNTLFITRINKKGFVCFFCSKPLCSDAVSKKGNPFMSTNISHGTYGTDGGAIRLLTK